MKTCRYQKCMCTPTSQWLFRQCSLKPSQRDISSPRMAVSVLTTSLPTQPHRSHLRIPGGLHYAFLDTISQSIDICKQCGLVLQKFCECCIDYRYLNSCFPFAWYYILPRTGFPYCDPQFSLPAFLLDVYNSFFVCEPFTSNQQHMTNSQG